jgi:methyl-accepting chemotaxis protein
MFNSRNKATLQDALGQAAAISKSQAEISQLNGISLDVVSALNAIEHVNEFVTSTAAAVEEQSTVTSDMSENMQRAARELAA